MVKLYNTLSRKIEDLKPIADSQIGLYTCGPTVYDFAHIGNLRTYIFEDLLRRVLEYNNYTVKHAMNITDVGHLVGDGDTGEDKLEVGAKREGKNPLDIAKVYEAKFIENLKELNIELPTEGPLRATDAIPEQIEIIKILEEKGFIYQDESAIYFDTSKLSDYGKLSGQNLADKKTGAREEVVVDQYKKNPQDFVLWFFLTGRYKNHILHWPSPWGEGFPGWHIECSAISRKLLGQPFDIHTGGVDHIGTHHTNEIAQSEAAFGLPLANVWMHGEFLLIDNQRMGKSEGNAWTLDFLKEKGFSPLDFRYMCLQAHYRTQINFSWESLQAAHNALEKLYDIIRSVIPSGAEESLTHEEGISSTSAKASVDKPLLQSRSAMPDVALAKSGRDDNKGSYQQKFADAINDDLNIARALAVTWEMIGDKDLSPEAKLNSLLEFDKVLGLGLGHPPKIIIPHNVQELVDSRREAKAQKDFAKSDELRKQIEDLGYELMDTPEGQKIRKK